MNNFNTNLDKNSANFVPLSPLSFISRVKDIYPNYDSLVYGNRKYTWLETYNRCTKFASSLSKQGITKENVKRSNELLDDFLKFYFDEHELEHIKEFEGVK